MNISAVGKSGKNSKLILIKSIHMNQLNQFNQTLDSKPNSF